MFDVKQRQFLSLGGCADEDIQALEAHAQTLTEAQRQRILHADALMMDQNMSIVEALEHVILDSKFSNLHDTSVLGWLPPVVLDEVIAWLEADAEDEESDEA